MRESNVNMSLFGNGDSSFAPSDGVKLHFHAYRYFAYEKQLALRELTRITGALNFEELGAGLYVRDPVDLAGLKSLTYFAGVTTQAGEFPTVQHELEESHRRVAGLGNRQSTRYSVHGLHEYKGRFNPQIARFLLNYLGSNRKTKVLDPFCGSGTTIIESALGGIQAVGIDANPLAVFLCNAKLKALTIPADEIGASLESVLRSLTRRSEHMPSWVPSDSRLSYLKKWFSLETLILLERLRGSIAKKGGQAESVLLSLVSDLLREYSLQEPSDLRIRRRISPFPSEPLLYALKKKADAFVRNLRASQAITGLLDVNCRALVGDSRKTGEVGQRSSNPRYYDLVITSPPYATALPYIDTQRLSLIWLGLTSVEDLRSLEAFAVGSREFGRNAINWDARLQENADGLPDSLATLCHTLRKALRPEDGFRRRATPMLIYRYFAEMRQVFAGLRSVLRSGARLAFVVGANHTTLGGQTFRIDSAESLANIAEHLGFRIAEVLRLETYQRYGLHQKNSINTENLTILEWH